MDARQALKRYFGHSEFRPGQQRLIEALLEGRDVLGVMPTGAGKSLCYQIPALLLEGITVVLSPLISLMQDQVAALTEAGVPAAFINSSLEPAEQRDRLKQAAEGRVKLLYVAPERLETEAFMGFAQQARIRLVAVDEAHCVSQWGQDFRPSYLKIAGMIEALPARPAVAAFTATATEQVKADIIQILGLREPLSLTTGFDRPNLYFSVSQPPDKMACLLEYLAGQRDKSGIVYCATRRGVETVLEGLKAAGIAATRYHAGLSDGERRQNQEDFVYDRARVMVATNAFGMGIDKSNVGFVVHYHMPQSLEAYYQEAGRAGRDGEAAQCLLLFSPGDVQTAKYLVTHPGENEQMTPQQRSLIQAQELERLDKMAAYCRTSRCLRAYLLDYFGDCCPEPCGSCGNCELPVVETDVTLQAQKILSAVARVERKYPYGLGMAAVLRMLRGSRDKRVLQLGLDKLPTYGILRDMDEARLRGLTEQLMDAGYLTQTAGEYPVLRLTEAAAGVLFHGQRVILKTRAQPQVKRRPEAAPPDAGLLGALKALRLRLAQRERLPAYIIFTNAALSDMAARRPATMEEFLAVPGVGEKKAQRYGQAFLEAIQAYEAAKEP